MPSEPIEVDCTVFEKTISGKSIGIAVDCKLTFVSVSKVGIKGHVNTPFGMLNDENAALIVDIVGDIMPEGFEHDQQMKDGGESFTKAFHDNHRALQGAIGKISQIYFEGGIGPPTVNFSLQLDENEGATTEYKKVHIKYNGKPNSHPHWLGSSPS